MKHQYFAIRLVAVSTDDLSFRVANQTIQLYQLGG
jgi:hypothetical protein